VAPRAAAEDTIEAMEAADAIEAAAIVYAANGEAEDIDETEAEDGLRSGVFLFAAGSVEDNGWLILKLWAGECNLLASGEAVLKSSSDLGLFGDIEDVEVGDGLLGLTDIEAEPIMLDSILLHAWVNIANGLTLFSWK
jgi:hypothetical protein